LKIAISNPVCAELLILLLAPNLEDIIPDTGFTNETPKLTLVLEIFVAVFTVPDRSFATTSTFYLMLLQSF